MLSAFILLTAIFILFRAPNSPIYKSQQDAFVSSNNTSDFKGKNLTASDASKKCSTLSDCPNTSSVIYIKFKLVSFAKYNNAKLHLYLTNESHLGGAIYIADNNWQDNQISWDHQPQTSSEVIASFGEMARPGWQDIELPGKYIKGKTELSLKITSNDKNPVSFASKEDIGHEPQISFSKLADNQDLSDNKILAAGDIACDMKFPQIGDKDCKDKETADIIKSKNDQIKYILAIGDLQYQYGQYNQFLDNFDKSWGQFKDKLKPAPGNHEYLNSVKVTSDGCRSSDVNDPFNYACGYFDYFNGKGNMDGQAGKRGQGYYAFSLGNWRIYSANSDCTFNIGCQVGGQQETWLRNDLAEHPGMCKLMYMHHPILSSNTNNYDAFDVGKPEPAAYLSIKENIDGMRNLYKAFYDYGGDLVLVGHVHDYERFDKQNIHYQYDPSGYREIIVGTGGRYSYTAPKSVMRPLSQVISNKDDKGILELDLANDKVSWDFLPTPGTNFHDSGQQTCNHV